MFCDIPSRMTLSVKKRGVKKGDLLAWYIKFVKCDESYLPMVRFAMASSKPKWISMFTSRLHAKKYPAI